MSRTLLYLVGVFSFAALAGCNDTVQQAPTEAEGRVTTEARIGRVSVDAQVSAVLFEASVTQQAMQKRNAIAYVGVLEERDELRRMIAESDASGEIRRLTNQLVDLEEAFIEELASQDAQYAELISTFRSGVERLAATPEGLQILAQREAGNLQSSIEALDNLVRQQFAKSQNRPAFLLDLDAIAKLALIDRRVGEASSKSLTDRFEELVELAPQNSEYRIQLAKLYRDAGDLNAAAETTQRAAEHAKTDWEKGDIYELEADIAAEKRDFAAMIDAAEKAVLARQEAASENDVVALRKLSTAWTTLAVANLSNGNNYRGAEEALRNALEVHEKRKAIMPEGINLKEDEFSILFTMWTVSIARGRVEESESRRLVATALVEELLEKSPESEGLWNDYYALSLNHAPLDFDAGRQQYAEKLTSIAERRVALDPNNEGYQQDLKAARGLLDISNFSEGDDPDTAIDALVDMIAAENRMTEDQVEEDSSIQQLRMIQDLAAGRTMSDVKAPKTPAALIESANNLTMMIHADAAKADRLGLRLLELAEHSAGENFFRPDWAVGVTGVYDALYLANMSMEDVRGAESSMVALIEYLEKVLVGYPGDRKTTEALDRAKRTAYSMSAMTGSSLDIEISIDFRTPKSPRALREEKFKVAEIWVIDPVRAERHYAELLELARQGASDRFHDPDWAKEVSEIYDLRYHSLMDAAAKKELAREAYSYLERVVSAHPDDAGSARLLEQAQYRVKP
jgi:tetratricopeptide (TPR) repeat protein